MNQSDKTLSKLMRAPLVKWPDLIGKLSQPQRLELSRAASGTIERLALLGEYAETHDQGHLWARAKARKVVVKVRRALGFSYPEQGLATVNF